MTAAPLRADQGLVEGKQHLIEGKYIIVAVEDKILHNNVEFAAVGQGEARPADEVPGLLQVQLQSDGEGHGGGLGGLVGRVAADLGEQLAVDVGFFVDVRVLLAGAVDELQQGLGETGVGLFQQLLQPGLAVADSAQSAPAGASPKANVWDVTLIGTDLGDDAVLSLRLLCPSGGTVRAYRNGGWQTLDVQVNGSYLIVEMRGISEMFCVESASSVPATLIAAAAAAVLAVLLLLVLVRKLAKRRRSVKVADSSKKDAKQHSYRN